MAESRQVSLRERVKAPPADAMVNAFYAPRVKVELEHCFPSEMLCHLAHGLMLAKQEIAPPDAIKQILRVVLELRESGPGALAVDFTQEDMYSYVERYIINDLGSGVGGWLHVGRSRNDLHTTTRRMVLREKLIAVIDALLSLRAATLDLASVHADTVMPGYTHSQHAQPVSLGYYFLAFSDVLDRDTARLSAALRRTDHCPLGAGALTTSGYPVDREYTANALGFPALVEVAYDAVSSRDDIHETSSGLALLMTNLSRLSLDLQNWNSLEYGFIELADEYSGVSSIMPQKKNPHPLEHTKAMAGLVTGSLSAVLSSTKNTSFSDVNDGVSAINAPTWQACDTTDQVVRLLRGVLETITVFPDVMKDSAERGFGTATELADIIVREAGLSFRVAHNIVGWVVREALESGRVATEIGVDDLDNASQSLFDRPLRISESALKEALDPATNLTVRTVIGGPAPVNVRRMVDERLKALRQQQEELSATKERIEQASNSLVSEAQSFVSA